MTETLQPEVTDPAHTIEPVAFDDAYIDHPFIPSRAPADVKAFLSAFAKAQSEYAPVLRERTVTIKPREGAPYQFKYAELANVIDATRALSKNGITVTQPVHEDLNKKLWLYTIVAHAEGGGQVTRISLMGSGEMKTFGGEITYIRRYTFGPAIGVASEDDADDSGHGGGTGDLQRRGNQEEEGRDEPTRRTATKPTPQRKAAAAPDPATKDAAKAAKPTPGAIKNLLGKIDALGLSVEDRDGMFTKLEVSDDADVWTLADWQTINAEVARRMAG